MLSEVDLLRWLQTQPLDETIDADGEDVYLKRYASGSELGGYLFRNPSHEACRRAMAQGFSQALEFDAGLGLAANGKDLILTQWLPDVRSWPDAAKPLENLLNQLTSWRTALAPPETARVSTKTTINRNEQRLRMMFAGGNS